MLVECRWVPGVHHAGWHAASTHRYDCDGLLASEPPWRSARCCPFCALPSKPPYLEHRRTRVPPNDAQANTRQMLPIPEICSNRFHWLPSSGAGGKYPDEVRQIRRMVRDPCWTGGCHGTTMSRDARGCFPFHTRDPGLPDGSRVSLGVVGAWHRRSGWPAPGALRDKTLHISSR